MGREFLERVSAPTRIVYQLRISSAASDFVHTRHLTGYLSPTTISTIETNHCIAATTQMARHARKKQKTEKPSDVKGTVRPLGSGSILLDDATKDDEERRLESMLFGTAYIPGEVQADGVLVVSDEEDAPNKEYQNLLDTDVSHTVLDV